MKTFKQFIEGVVVPFPTKKAPLSPEANRRGFFLAQEHKSKKDVLHSAQPLFDDMQARGYSLMRDGLPDDISHLKHSIGELHKATEQLPRNGYPNHGVYLNHGSDEIGRSKLNYVSDVKHHDHGITTFEDGYGGNSGIGLPKNFTHEHLKNHLTPKKT